MLKKEQEELKNEIQHIFDSGANEIRIFEMVKMFIDNRSVVNNLPIDFVSFSLRDKIAMEVMNGELSAQNFETGEHWANEVHLAERSYLVADAMIKARGNES